MGRRQRRKFKAEMEPRTKGFDPKRGREYFVISLVVLTIMAGFSALNGAPISFPSAFAFVLGASVVAGVWGMFTDNVGL